MMVVVDNNLPWRMARMIESCLPSHTVRHLSELGMSDLSDAEIRRRMGIHFVVRITRDEDFWLDAPTNWAIVWVDCHNPPLTFLRTTLAPAIAKHIPGLVPGTRLWVTEDMLSVV